MEPREFRVAAEQIAADANMETPELPATAWQLLATADLIERLDTLNYLVEVLTLAVKEQG